MGCGSSQAGRIISADDFSPSANKNPTAITRRESQLQLQKRASQSSLALQTKPRKPSSTQSQQQPQPQSQSRPAAIPQEASAAEPVRKTHSRSASKTSRKSQSRSLSGSTSSKKSSQEPVASSPPSSKEATENEVASHPPPLTDAEAPPITEVPGQDQMDGGMISAIAQIGDSPDNDDNDEGKPAAQDELPEACSSQDPASEEPATGHADSSAIAALAIAGETTQAQAANAQTAPSDDQQPKPGDAAAEDTRETPGEQPINAAASLGPGLALDSSRSAHTMGSRHQPAKAATRSSHAIISPVSDAKPTSSEQSAVDVPGDECTQVQSTTDLLADDASTQPAAVQQPREEAGNFTAVLAAPQLLAATQSTRNMQSHPAAEDRSTRSSHAMVDLTKTPVAKDTPETQPPANAEPHERTEQQPETAEPAASDAAPSTKFVATLGAPQSLQATQSTHQVGAQPLGGHRGTRSGHAIVDLTKPGTTGEAQPAAAAQPESQAAPAGDAAEPPSPEVAPVGFTARLDAAQQLEATRSTQVIGTQLVATNRATRSGHAIVRTTGTENAATTTTAPEAKDGSQQTPEAEQPPPAPGKFVAELSAPQQLQATQSTAAAVGAQPMEGDRSARSMHAFVDLSKSPAAGRAADDNPAPPPETNTPEAGEALDTSEAVPALTVKPAVSLGPEETLLTSRSAVVVHCMSPLPGDRSTASSSGLLDASPVKSPLSCAAEPALTRSHAALPTDDSVPQHGKEASGGTAAEPTPAATAAPTETEHADLETQEPASSRLGAPVMLLSSQSTTVATRSLAQDSRSTRSSSGTADVTTCTPAAPATPKASPSAKAGPECNMKNDVAIEDRDKATAGPAAEASADNPLEDAGAKAMPSKQLGEPEILLSSQSSTAVVRHNLKKADASTRSSGPSFNSSKGPALPASQLVVDKEAQTVPAPADKGGETQEAASSDQPTQTTGKPPATAARELGPPQSLLASTSTVQATGSSLRKDDRSTRSSIATVPAPATPPAAAAQEHHGEGKASEPLDAAASVEKDPAPEPCPAAVGQAKEAPETQGPSPTEEESAQAAPSTGESGSKIFVAVLDPPQSLLSSTSSTATGVRKEPIPELRSTSGHSLKLSPAATHVVPSIAVQAPSARSSRQDLRSSKEELTRPAADEGEKTEAKESSKPDEATSTEEKQASSIQQETTEVEAVSTKAAPTTDDVNTEASTQPDPAVAEANLKEENPEAATAAEESAEKPSPADQQPTEPAEKASTGSDDQPPSTSDSSTNSPFISRSNAKQLALEAQKFKLKSNSASAVHKVEPKEAEVTTAKHRADTATASGVAAAEEPPSSEIEPEPAAAVTDPASTKAPVTDTEGDSCPERNVKAPEQAPSAEDAPELTGKKVEEAAPGDVVSPSHTPSTVERKPQENDKQAVTAAASPGRPGKTAVSSLIEAEVKITSKSMSAIAKTTGDDSDEEGKPLNLKEASASVIGGSTSNMAKAATSGRPLKTAAKRSGSKGSIRSSASKSSLSASRSSVTASQYSLRS